MTNSVKWLVRLLVTTACGAGLAAGAAYAERPPWAGEGGRGKHGAHGKFQNRNVPPPRELRPRRELREAHFFDRHRLAVRDYYAEEWRAGRCPPGLAKKRNGCLPPGQAKRWRIGQRLPAQVVHYELPPTLVASLGPPPSGHRYVRVAGDILLIAIGTSLVVDALSDLGRM